MTNDPMTRAGLPVFAIACACIISLLAFGPRSAFDLLTRGGEWYRVVPTGFDYRCLGPDIAAYVPLRRMS